MVVSTKEVCIAALVSINDDVASIVVELSSIEVAGLSLELVEGVIAISVVETETSEALVPLVACSTDEMISVVESIDGGVLVTPKTDEVASKVVAIVLDACSVNNVGSTVEVLKIKFSVDETVSTNDAVVVTSTKASVEVGSTKVDDAEEYEVVLSTAAVVDPTASSVLDGFASTVKVMVLKLSTVDVGSMTMVLDCSTKDVNSTLGGWTRLVSVLKMLSNDDELDSMTTVLVMFGTSMEVEDSRVDVTSVVTMLEVTSIDDDEDSAALVCSVRPVLLVNSWVAVALSSDTDDVSGAIEISLV